MMIKCWHSLFACIFLLITFTSYAADETPNFLIVQSCFLSNKFSYTEIGRVNNLALINTNDLQNMQKARVQLHSHCRGFMNVTKDWQDFSKNKKTGAAQFVQNYLAKAHAGNALRGYQIQHQEIVNPLLALIDTKRLAADLNVLTAFPDRFVDSNSGVQASNWIAEQAKGFTSDITIETLPALAGKQPSVLVKLGKHLSGPGIVIGAHIDTPEKTHEYKPGADDDASGAAVLLETLRILANSHVEFQQPIYLIWYAGEEQGKLGSQSVIAYFKRKHIPISAVLQLDQTGFVDKTGAGIGLTDDYTDISLTAFVADLVATYVKLPASAVHCGFACCDHIVWYQNNTPVAYPFETMNDATNPFVLTRNDKVNKLSLTHMGDFVELAVAFAVELGSRE